MRIARGASVDRARNGRAALDGGSGAAARPTGAELSAAARAAARRPAPTATAAQTAATPSAPTPEPDSGAAGAPVSGPSASFSFGGGLALLVSALLLTAGPRLRRHLAMPSVVCRPAAFIAVLERPG